MTHYGIKHKGTKQYFAGWVNEEATWTADADKAWRDQFLMAECQAVSLAGMDRQVQKKPVVV